VDGLVRGEGVLAQEKTRKSEDEDEFEFEDDSRIREAPKEPYRRSKVDFAD
jgi:hypothetical protein